MRFAGLPLAGALYVADSGADVIWRVDMRGAASASVPFAGWPFLLVLSVLIGSIAGAAERSRRGR